MNRNTATSGLLFITLAAAVLGTWYLVEKFFIPPPPTLPEPKPARETMLALGGAMLAKEPALADWRQFTNIRSTTVAPVAPVPPPKPIEQEPYQLIALGGDDFNLRVVLTSKGAGVQNTILQAFDQSSREGRIQRDEQGQPLPLELIPGYRKSRDSENVVTPQPRKTLSLGKVDLSTARELTEPSYTLLHYATDEKHPSPELAQRTWKVVAQSAQEVSFETTLDAPYHIVIRKTFTLNKSDYHIGMKLSFQGVAGARSTDARTRANLRYQIVGPRGLALEGEWYTTTFRNALVGWRTPSGYGKRDIQTNRAVVIEHGGYKVEQEGNAFTYAAVQTQFFTSALCLDPDVDEASRKTWWAYARPTREDNSDIPDDKSQLGDITVRAVSNPIDPEPGASIQHSYWLYNGPTKVRLLKKLDQLEKDKQQFGTTPELVDRYVNELTLFTLTDAPTPNWFGRLADTLFWTSLVVWFTNLMHDVLGLMHHAVPSWGLNIIMLTVLVRLLLMIPSRRQQASMMKLQDKMSVLKPEMDKIAEKYKADPQRLQQEKTRLMLSSGVNPLSSMGGCLLMFAQMPIFMGLYFCLQESIFFRLDSFLWIKNLAAPDMLLWWTERIPYLSQANEIGGMIYLGPYLNILPIIAVTLMFINMKVSSPPPTDEQQAMQQNMMKYMMIFMAFVFYKMAAGMCVYFIVSTSWGLTERFFLKRKQKRIAEDKKNNPQAELPTTLAAKPEPKATGFLQKFRGTLMERLEEAQKQAEGNRQIINKPQTATQPKPSQQDKRKKRKRK